MPIANRALYKSNSWGRPKLDLGGCVLYLPLWRPSNDMTGSTIYSYDGNVIPRISGAVTGATWSSLGRTLNGIGDNINFGDILNSTIAGADKQWSLAMWLKTNQAAQLQVLFYKGHPPGTDEREIQFRLGSSAVTTDNKLCFLFYADGAGVNHARVKSTSALTSTTKPYFVVLQYDGTIDTSAVARVKFFIDNVSDTAVEEAGYAWTSAFDINAGAGALIVGFTAVSFSGLIGEILLESKLWSAGERAQIYNATKWLYS